MIPVTVIGGYLGAGKTTLINRLLASDHGRRLAVLVNDFGDINIDAELITAHDGETISLANGCVCCTIADALGDALDRVLALEVAPEHIVIEASGVANPAKIAMYGQGWPGLRLDGVVVLADGESVRAQASDKFVGATIRQQLAAADLLILNKIDLLSVSEREAVRTWLTDDAADVGILDGQFGDVPAMVLLGRYAGAARFQPVTVEHANFKAVPFQSIRPMDRSRLEAGMSKWPSIVLRAKGWVYLRDDPGHIYYLQSVGRRRTLEKGAAWDDRQPETQLILIGAAPTFDPSWLHETLSSACT